jgi:hypothetical protein
MTMNKLTIPYVKKLGKSIGFQVNDEQCNAVILEYPDWCKLNPDMSFNRLVKNIIYFILE